MLFNPVNELTSYICPITGSKLIYEGTEEHVMDGESYYHASSDSKIRYSRHPFSWNRFNLLKAGSEIATKRIFLLDNDEKVFTEYRRIKGIPFLVRVGTSTKQIQKWIKIEKKKRKREAKKRNKIDFSSVVFPMVRRVFAQTVSMDIVSVQPMSMPSGQLFFFDGFNRHIGVFFKGKNSHNIRAGSIRRR